MGDRRQGGDVTELFVGNLVKEGDLHSADNLRTFFEQFGAIVDVDLKTDNQTGLSKGFAFVQFQDPVSVDIVIDNYENNVLGNVWLDCKRSVPR